MEFYEKMKKEKTNRHEGILPFLGNIYKSIVYNIKKNNLKFINYLLRVKQYESVAPTPLRLLYLRREQVLFLRLPCYR